MKNRGVREAWAAAAQHRGQRYDVARAGGRGGGRAGPGARACPGSVALDG